jgi:rhodanese-related sulfurtransferase
MAADGGRVLRPKNKVEAFVETAINVLTLSQRIKTAPDATVLDVRRRADLLANPRRIPGAQWRDPEQVERWAGEFAQGQPVVVYDLTGAAVSQTVAARLRREGIDACHLAGGLVAWMTWIALEARRG